MQHSVQYPLTGRVTAICLLMALVFNCVHALADSGRGRHKKLYALPVQDSITIDGSLDDWDFSGHVESFVRSETRDSVAAQFAVMYDDAALYIGAQVKDPSPMLNRHSPEADADKAWKGDCTQFRLVTDRELPFPYIKGNLGNAPTGADDGQPLHLMLWYFTDEKRPALQIHKSFAMEPVREEWAPHGVVPEDNFEAAYKKHADGKGYSYEYRIPWETLNAAEQHPKAGDVVTATAQFLWSDASGLNNREGTYDVMSRPGFPWQTSDVWGKMIFMDHGDIPRSWVEPFDAPEPPTPLTFDYELPEDADVSVALFDDRNRIVKHIVAEGSRQAGKVVENWDGLDMNGDPLPVGEYRWKGLYHDPITTRYVMSVGNSGQPPYKTADGTGGWGGDYGPPTAACVAGDRMILGWTGHENGWGIIATDLNGKKIWGAKQKDAAILATDGKRFFAPGEHGGKEINVYSVANGQPLAFENGRQGLEPPEGGDEESNRPTGVACHEGDLYASFGARDVIGMYDAGSGDLKTTWTVDSPGRLAVTKDGVLLAVSGDRVVWVKDGNTIPFAADHIDKPAGIALDDDGNVYIANQGNLQNVSVFTQDGNYLRSIGKTGGRPREGKWEADGMLQPAGIAVDGEGKLWVPEATYTTKRLSVWSTESGRLADEFFGACSYSPFMWIDPQNPSEAFFDNTIWDVDLEKGTWYPKSVYYSRTSGNTINNGHGGFFYPFRVFTASNGRQYAVSKVYAFGPVLWIREGLTFRPLYFMFKNHPNPVLMAQPPFPMMNDTEEYPPGTYYVWTDENADEEAQPDELTVLPSGRREFPPFFNWMDSDLNLYGQGAVYRPVSIGDDGVPVYDFTNPEKLDVQPDQAQMWVDPDAERMWTWRDGGRSDIGFAQWNSDAKMSWGYPPLQTWRAAINEGIPQPGNLVGPTCPLGVANRYTGLISYFGTAEIVRDDGLFVSQVFEQQAYGNNGPDVFYVEFLAGQLLQPEGSDRYYILAGDQDARVNEVIGLNTVKDLPGGIYEHTEEKAKTAADAWADYKTLLARGQPLALARGGEAGLETADTVEITVDEKRSFAVTASYDEENLYLHYSLTSPAPLVNKIQSAESIFKGGNLLDIQIAGDPSADPERENPAPGDVRLLVSRRESGEVVAVVLRPKVAGFDGEPIKLVSPTGSETFDMIATTDKVKLKDYKRTRKGFDVTVVVPREVTGLPKLQPGDTVRMDIGYIFGDVGGTQAAMRAYWHNNSFTANVVNDVPNESRLEPHEWGEALVE